MDIVDNCRCEDCSQFYAQPVDNFCTEGVEVGYLNESRSRGSPAIWDSGVIAGSGEFQLWARSGMIPGSAAHNDARFALEFFASDRSRVSVRGAARCFSPVSSCGGNARLSYCRYRAGLPWRRSASRCLARLKNFLPRRTQQTAEAWSVRGDVAEQAPSPGRRRGRPGKNSTHGPLAAQRRVTWQIVGDAAPGCGGLGCRVTGRRPSPSAHAHRMHYGPSEVNLCVNGTRA